MRKYIYLWTVVMWLQHTHTVMTRDIQTQARADPVTGHIRLCRWELEVLCSVHLCSVVLYTELGQWAMQLHCLDREHSVASSGSWSRYKQGVVSLVSVSVRSSICLMSGTIINSAIQLYFTWNIKQDYPINRILLF